MTSTPIDVPERLNIAEWFIDRRVQAGLGGTTALLYPGSGAADPAREVSYAELLESSCRVANLLRSLGLVIEDRVLLVMPDSPMFVAAYFGVARAGCVTVSVSAWLETREYAYYLEYARPTAVIVDAEIWPLVAAARHAAGPRTKHWLVHQRSGALRFADTIDLASACASQPGTADVEPTYRDDPATWLSSSGSTGLPKCSVHTHHSVVWGTVAYGQRTLQVRRDDITLCSSKLFFGYAAANLLYALSVGARYVLIPGIPEPAEYFELLERYAVTLFATIPTTIAAMLHAADREPSVTQRDLAKLERLTSAGETLPLQVHRSWRDRFGVEIYDAIGSTEMFHLFIANRLGDVKDGSLGRIVEGYAYEIDDDDGNPVEPGTFGNLTIRGPSAASGYWRMLDKSRATFHGDRVVGSDKFMVDAEGYFWYGGRNDDIFKCSGVFVSPIEVEAVLAEHPAVGEAAVVGFRDTDGLVRVMAYVVPSSGDAATRELSLDLIAHCCLHLPIYKAPRRIAFVDELPHTPSGKLSRAPLRERALRDTTTQLVLREAAGVLALDSPDQLDLTRAFAELGLNSLRAVELRNAIEQRVGLSLDPTVVMRNPSLDGLVEALMRAQREHDTDDHAAAMAVVRVPRDRPLPLSSIQRRFWQISSRPGWTPHNTVNSFELVGPLDREALVLAFADVVERHEALRTTQVLLENVAYQQILATGGCLEIEDMSALEPEAQAKAVAERVATEHHFRFGEGQACTRAYLLALGPTRHALVITIDHIHTDLWSVGVLMEDLGFAYRSRVEQRAPEFAPLAFAPADYAVWEQAHLAGPRLDALLDHWRSKLAGAAELSLPTDHPYPERLAEQGTTMTVAFTPAHAEAIRGLARTHAVTTFVVLLATWQLLLSHYSGQRDVVVGSFVANRTRRELEDLIGCFMNFVALRSDLSGDPSFSQLLARASTTVLDALEHQQAPIDLVIDALGLPRKTVRRPLFQSIVVLQDAATLDGTLGEGLRFAPLPVARAEVSRFELMLSCAPTATGIEGFLRYSTQLFERKTIATIGDDLLRLLDEAARGPSRPISQILALAQLRLRA